MTSYKDLTTDKAVELIVSNPEMMDMIRIMAANSISHAAIQRGEDFSSPILRKGIVLIMEGNLDHTDFVRSHLAGFVALLKGSEHFQRMYEDTKNIPPEETTLSKLRREQDQSHDPMLSMFTEMLKKAGLKVMSIPGIGLAVEVPFEDEGKVNKIFEDLERMDSSKPH